MRLADLIRSERRRQRRPLWAASACAMAAAAAAIALLGLSGWFISAAALAGAAGAAMAFNYMLPSAAIRLLAISRTACRYGERLEGHRAALRALARIRPAVFSALAAAPPAKALALSTGEASARLVQDVDAVETLFVRISARWGAVAALAAGTALSGLAGWRCAAATAGAFMLSVVAASALARRTARACGRDLQRAAGRLKDAYAALYAAAPEIAAYGLQSWAEARIAAEGEALAAARRAAHRGEGWQACLSAGMAAWAAALVLLLAHSAPLPLAALAALCAFVTVEGGAGLARGFLQDGAVEEAERRLDPVLAAAPAVRSASPRMRSSAGRALAIHASARSGAVLAAGERLAVAGPSGCGKTTLLEQLLKLRQAERGRFILDGVDIVDLAAPQVRAAFAYAPQDPTLLSGGVGDNLRLGAPGATDAALWEALADAGLDERIRRFPAGLDAMIGEAGERLSGGERRRLSLARALVRPAPWLLLDEPTEGLDRETEALVIARLERRLRRTGQGLVLVSHRPAALALCGRTLRLDTPPPLERAA